MSPSLKRTALLVAGGAAVAAALAYAFRPRPVRVETTAVGRGPVLTALEEDGVTRVREPYVVSAPMSGAVSRIKLEAGDAVKRDEALAVLRPAEAPLLDATTRKELEERVRAARQAEVQARAALDGATALALHAKRELERTRGLAEGGSLPRVELERAELEVLTREKDVQSATAGVRMAAHEVEIATTALGRTRDAHGGDEWPLKAATDGTVLQVMHESEGVVAAGTPLLSIGDLSDMVIALDVLTTDAVRIPPGAEVVLERWGGAKPLRGRVSKVGSSAHTKMSSLGVEEQRVDVTVELLSPREEWTALGDGYRVRGRIVLDRAPDVVKLPTSAVVRRPAGWAVYVVEGGVARERAVTVGLRNGRETAIDQGVTPGEHVVLHPSDEIADGARVQALEVVTRDVPGG